MNSGAVSLPWSAMHVFGMGNIQHISVAITSLYHYHGDAMPQSPGRCAPVMGARGQLSTLLPQCSYRPGGRC